MSSMGDRADDFTRHVRNALEDEAAQPLSQLERVAPEDCNYFSELEASISEWSFGYGVAWALARMGDPLLSSGAAAAIAEKSARDAWRLFSDQSWTELMAQDRAQRGPVEGDGAPADLGQFMSEVGRSRARREQRAAGA